jgi:hypothetical protein
VEKREERLSVITGQPRRFLIDHTSSVPVLRLPQALVKTVAFALGKDHRDASHPQLAQKIDNGGRTPASPSAGQDARSRWWHR